MRGLGRLQEALEVMQKNIELTIENRDWRETAVGFNNISGIHLTLGNLGDAFKSACDSLEYIEKPEDTGRLLTQLGLPIELTENIGMLMVNDTVFD